jgi:uncharacterized SAM-dependent methyltransferase
MDALSATSVLESQPAHDAFRDDVLTGLLGMLKRLPGKYAFDHRGSMLYEAACAQPEFYLARAEQEIMERLGREMAREVGEPAMVIELGGAGGINTWQLLKHLERPVAYVPVDSSAERLQTTAERLSSAFPAVSIEPVCADFTSRFELPLQAALNRVIYFPGSKIGDFEPTAAVRLLGRVARLCRPHGGMLVGIDLVKDPAVIEAAYNDRAGVTA